MQNESLARRAGLAGMAGAAAWILSLILEYTLGLYPPDGSGSLYVANQLLALAGLAGVAFGVLGILWGGGVCGRLGKIGVWMFASGYALLILGGVLALAARSDDSPIFLIFPIGALLMDIGVIITGVAVWRDGGWTGWQRYVPLVYAVILWGVIEIPFFTGVYGEDGPGFWPELVQGIGLFVMALTVYTESSIAAEPGAATNGAMESGGGPSVSLARSSQRGPRH